METGACGAHGEHALLLVELVVPEPKPVPVTIRPL